MRSGAASDGASRGVRISADVNATDAPKTPRESDEVDGGSLDAEHQRESAEAEQQRDDAAGRQPVVAEQDVAAAVQQRIRVEHQLIRQRHRQPLHGELDQERLNDDAESDTIVPRSSRGGPRKGIRRASSSTNRMTTAAPARSVAAVRTPTP